ncbi:MAG TPA: S8 family serine peptidase [Paraburkholderia sp.]
MTKKGGRPKTVLIGFQNSIRKTVASWSVPATRLAGRSVAGATLPLALAACNGGNTTADVTPAASGKSEVATAGAADPAGVSSLAATQANARNQADQAPNDRFIVKYKLNSNEGRSPTAVQSKLDRLASRFPRAHHLRRMGGGADIVTTESKLTAREAKTFMDAIAKDPNVEYVEPDRFMSAQFTPNDPGYGNQWGLSSNLTSPYGTYGIRAETAWNLAFGYGVVMAVVDTGVTTHSDLNANMLPGYNFVSPNRGGDGSDPGITTETWCSSVVWHGTHVAGIMGALSNNGNGIAGMAPGAKMVPVRVLDGCGRGVMSDVADGIVWAAGGTIPGVPVNANPAKIINVSISGGSGCGATLQSAIDSAVSRGSIVIAAAGNNGNDVAYASPANCFNVINVSATNSNGSRWVSSNFGTTVDIAAPGSNIWSTYNSGARTPGIESYGFLNGTSMAAPLVSGVAALVQAIAPKSLTTAEMRTLLQKSAQPFPSGQPDQPLGPGILDAGAALISAYSGKIPTAADFWCQENRNLMQVQCFDRSTSRGIAITEWDWNWGTTANFGQLQSGNPIFSFEYPGNTTITLKVIDANGVVSTLKRPFYVDAPPIFSLDYLGNGNPERLDDVNGGMTFNSLTIPAGAKSLTLTLKPGRPADSAWLYLRADTPSVLNVVCQSGMSNNRPATCTVSNPKAGTWYAATAATSDLQNAQLSYVLN